MQRLSFKTNYQLNTSTYVCECLQESNVELLFEKEPKRNINCKNYLKCLDDAAKVNASELPCEKCFLNQDNTYKMDDTDFFGLIHLYCQLIT